ncbi:hypothetical protein HZA87_03155 [Candidatus Uhrbacteria bacterium]|nr:hypothetical protein [Candidatus Uhrbacteria bacterium]
MITIENHIGPRLDTETARIKKKYADVKLYPGYGDLIDELISDFGNRFRGPINTQQELLDLCGRVGEMLSDHQIPPDLLEEIRKTRIRLWLDLAESGMKEGALEGSMPTKFELQFPVTPGRPNGHRVKNPPQDRQDEEFESIVEKIAQQQNCDLLRLAGELGIDAAADVLCALGQVGEDERARVISFLSAYLGKSARGESIGLPGLLSYPKAVLDIPSVRMVVRRLLLQDSYEMLLEAGADDPAEFENVRKHAGSMVLKRMQALGKSANVSDPDIHALLFVELKDFFARACNQKHPKNFVKSVRENNVDCPLPSLRQCIATQLIRERRKLYVAFEPGKGKTPPPFLLAEQIFEETGKRQRILYLAPPVVVKELPNRIRPGSAPKSTRDCYYVDPQQGPTVGVVQSRMTTDKIAETVCENDVVFCPYSMLHSERKIKDDEEEEEKPEPGEEALEDDQVDKFIDLLCSQEWDMVVLDEATFVDGNKTWTRLVDKLLHGENGKGTKVSREGYMIAQSGTPIMNTVADPVVIHDLFLKPSERRKKYKQDIRRTDGRDTATERGLDPMRVRQALNETLLILDKPEQWLDHVFPCEYNLSVEEESFLRAICSNPNISAQHKIDACMQFILCPQLISGDETMPESLLAWATQQLDTDLKKKNTILIAENMRAESVLRTKKKKDELEPTEMDQHFYERIRKYCEEWSERNNMPVHFYTVHGKTPEDDRQKAYEDAALAKKNGTHKVVILAMSQCLNMGIKLETERMIALEWPYNSPDLQQLLKRALREGNLDVFMTAFIAIGTVHHGNYEQSMDKYKDALLALYGAGISDEMLGKHIGYRSLGEESPNTEDMLTWLLERSSPAQTRY